MKKSTAVPFLESEFLIRRDISCMVGTLVQVNHRAQGIYIHNKDNHLTFTDFSLGDSLHSAVEAMNFSRPTPVQESVIPLILEDTQDIVALAQTGTGKTAAFGLPIAEKLRGTSRSTGALVLCPTRELALQIRNELRSYTANIPEMKVEAVYGGAGYGEQISALRRGAQIVVATPGRLLDLIQKNKTDFEALRYLVLDEADIMLNMGFKEELDAILEALPAERRTVLLSATMPKEVAEIASTYMRDPHTVSMGPKNAAAESVEHIAFPVQARQKYEGLKRLVDYHPDMYGIIFCRTKASTQEIADRLVQDGYNVESLHGDLSQNQREQVMRKFKRKNLQLIVATDIASRGLDVQDLSHVIHYDLPDEIDIYTHRSGRTGRAGKSGTSYALVGPREQKRLMHIERVIQRKIRFGTIPEGDDIFRRQLLDFAETLSTTESRDAQLEAHIAALNERLGDMSREALLRKIVSLQFSEMFGYYQDLPDMKPPKKTVAASSHTSFKKERRKKKSGAQKRHERSKTGFAAKGAEEGFESVRVNLGKRDRVAPPDLIGLVNQSARNRNIEIGRINISSAWSTLQVEDEHAASVVEALNGFTYEGRTVRAQMRAS